MNAIALDFEQAKAKHLLFKSRLRSILYDLEVDDSPVLSHYECGVGKWIYGHALAAYGHLPQMRTLERVHADIHTTARRLVVLYRDGNQEEARQGLAGMEQIADRLVALLDELEVQLREAEPAEGPPAEAYISLGLKDFGDMLSVNQELDRRIKEQVTATARAAAELAERDNQFRTITDAAPVALWLSDEHGGITFVNQSWVNWTGRSFADSLGLGWVEAIVEEDRQRAGETFARDLAARAFYEVDFRIRHVDGSLRWCVATGVPRYRADGAFAGYAGACADITERKLAESRLKDYYSDLETKVAFRNLDLEREVRELRARLAEAN